VHLVGLFFEVVEEALDPVPAAAFPCGVWVGGEVRVAVEDPVLVVGGEFVEWGSDGDPAGNGAAEEVLLAFAVGGALEGLDEPVADGEGFVREGAVEIDADDPAEAAAVRAGTERVIEGEEGRGELASSACNILMKLMWLASLVRPDIFKANFASYKM
jgi:hypothetical protein